MSQIRDTESCQDLSDVLTKVKFSCLAWLHDNTGLFYNVSCYCSNTTVFRVTLEMLLSFTDITEMREILVESPKNFSKNASILSRLIY